IRASPRDSIYQRDILHVYKYRRSTPALHATPVLLVYSLINRPSVMDLQPGRSVVESLLAEGFDVYLLDWGIPNPCDQALDLQDYIKNFLRTAVRQVCLHHEVDQLHLLGYCMGGSFTAMFTALYPERVKNLLLLGTPLHFRSEKMLYGWAQDKRFDVGNIVEAWSMAPPWSFDGYSILTLDGKARKLQGLYENIDKPGFLDSYVATEQWVNDNIPMAGAAYVEFCRKCFVHNDLSEGRMTVGGTPVDLGKIECPVLIIGGTSDHLVPPETLGSNLFKNSETILFEAGHVGLSISGKAHKVLWPKVAAWMAARN
ncbi:unnamed protein product, partial [Phaeothamnion confervicola]